MQERTFKYLVLDEFGDALKKFQSLQEAKWFVEKKLDCQIVKLDFQIKSGYTKAYELVGVCVL